MKWLIIVTLMACCSACTSVDSKQMKTTSTSHTEIILPVSERAFVKAIEHVDKKTIVAQLGEPAKAEDVKIRDSNRIVASIWHYHNINTDENGVYYEMTELDFIDDKVVQVVFLNNNGAEEITNKDHTYKIPK